MQNYVLNGTNFAHILKSRELGYRRKVLKRNFPPNVERKLDEDLSKVMGHIKSLSLAIAKSHVPDIELAISDIVMQMIDTNASMNANYKNTLKKKQHREMFVSLGGMRLIMCLLSPPYAPSDARNLSKDRMVDQADFWNEILVLMREMISAVPSISDKCIENKHLIFLFTLLHHYPVFDNVMNLLEEILVSREDTFFLGSVPSFYTLVNSFSSRQLAHFCRVLSLVVFEPEDRQIMEGSHVLRSVDLLQLRRNRMSKNSTGLVERNQNLIIEMPNLLPRLIQILRVINFGPSLHDLISHNIVTQIPITGDVLCFHSTRMGITDWNHFMALENLAHKTNNVYNEQDITEDLLQAFSPSMGNGGRAMELSNIVNVMHLAQRLEIAEFTPLGHALLMAHPYIGNNANNNGGTPQSNENLFSRVLGNLEPPRRRTAITLNRTDPVRAHNELKFNAMLLIPHQIELIFVLCTLLSGRRKLAVQKKLAELHLESVLCNMYDRMSWDAPAYAGPNQFEHIHGPNCECNPESAVRIQFLRLVHNFYDRDFLGNRNKLLVLSPSEQQFVMNQNVEFDAIERGLLSKIINTLTREKSDSPYRFWLSACVENFLRGCGQRGQMLVMNNNILPLTITHIIQTANTKSSNTLQTSFDLLGEIIKGNPNILEYLEVQLSHDEFKKLITVIMNNLVDSNVFLRSLYLSLELVNTATNIDLSGSSIADNFYSKFGFVRNALNYEENLYLLPHHNNNYLMDQIPPTNVYNNKPGYLIDTWMQYSPQPLSKLAVDLYSDDKLLTDIKKRSSKKKNGAHDFDSYYYSNHSTIKKIPSTSSSFARLERTNNNDVRRPTTHHLRFGNETNQIVDDVPRAAPSSSSSSVLNNINNSNHAFFSDYDVYHSLNSSHSTSRIWDENEILCEHLIMTEEEPVPITQAPPTLEETSATNENNDLNLAQEELFSRLIKSNYGNAAGNTSIIAVAQENRDIFNNETIHTSKQSSLHYSAKDPANTGSMDNLLDAIDHYKSYAGGENSATLDPYTAIPMKDDGSSAINSYNTGFGINPNLFRISMFLVQEKTNILLKLMSIVSLRTINHENICCLNTSLLILLFDFHRGILAQTLQKIRQLADKEFQGHTAKVSSKLASYRSRYQSPLTTSKRKVHCQHCERPNSACKTIFESEFSKGSSSNQPYCSNCLPSRPLIQTGGDIVMINYRELLWYWREYYLRRGRDRLSIEFSSHVPFRFWLQLVDVLCSDDGSDMAVVSHPIPLPSSPYNKSISTSLVFGRGSDYPSVLNFS